jgi:hypothetical protein
MTEPAPPVVEEVCPLVIPVEKIAKRLGLDVPPTDDDAEAIAGAIYDAQAEVEGYLGRPITPTVFVQTNSIAYTDGWHLSESKVIEVQSAVPETDPVNGEPTGRYTVTYLAGIDATQPIYLPIRRYIEAAVLDHGEIARIWQAKQGTKAARRERSVSVEGQSISWDYLTPSGVDGKQGQADRLGTGRPSLASMDRWRLAGRRVFQRAGRSRVVYL